MMAAPDSHPSTQPPGDPSHPVPSGSDPFNDKDGDDSEASYTSENSDIELRHQPESDNVAPLFGRRGRIAPGSTVGLDAAELIYLADDTSQVLPVYVTIHRYEQVGMEDGSKNMGWLTGKLQDPPLGDRRHRRPLYA